MKKKLEVTHLFNSDKADSLIKTVITAILVLGFLVAVLSQFNWSLQAAVEWAWNGFLSAVMWVAGFFQQLIFN